MKENDKYSLFTGDSIIGSDSTFFMDYPSYFSSLLKTKELIVSHDISTLYVGHSLTLHTKDVCLAALPKVSAYIERRVRRDRHLETLAKHLLEEKGTTRFNIDEFYQFQTKMTKKRLSEDHVEYFKYMTDK